MSRKTSIKTANDKVGHHALTLISVRGANCVSAANNAGTTDAMASMRLLVANMITTATGSVARFC